MTSIQFVRQCRKISNFTRSDSLTSFLFAYTRTIERGWPSCPLFLRAGVHQVHVVGSWTPPPDKHQPLFPCRHQQQPREDALTSIHTRTWLGWITNTSAVHFWVPRTEGSRCCGRAWFGRCPHQSFAEFYPRIGQRLLFWVTPETYHKISTFASKIVFWCNNS